MKTILAAAILFPITFLIFSYLFEDSSSSNNGKNRIESRLEYNIECQYNAIEEFKQFEVCSHQTNQLNYP